MGNPVENRLSEKLTQLKWRHSRVSWPSSGLARIHDAFHAPLGLGPAELPVKPVTIEIDALSRPRDIRVRERGGTWVRLGLADADTQSTVAALLADLQAAGFFA